MTFKDFYNKRQQTSEYQYAVMKLYTESQVSLIEEPVAYISNIVSGPSTHGAPQLVTVFFIIRVTKLRITGWVVHVACYEELKMHTRFYLKRRRYDSLWKVY
jgi:hypothetical protein